MNYGAWPLLRLRTSYLRFERLEQNSFYEIASLGLSNKYVLISWFEYDKCWRIQNLLSSP